MKIVTSEEMRRADEATFARVGIPSRAVMEAAGREVASFALERFRHELRHRVLVICGGGNNGGDGLVIARCLRGLGVEAEVALCKPLSQLTEDARANAASFQVLGGRITELNEANWQQAPCCLHLSHHALVIDALYGSGFKGSMTDFPAAIVAYLNECRFAGGPGVLSVDIPSGVEADTGNVHGVAVYADETVALQCLKFAHVLFPGAKHCGNVHVTDIGVPKALPELDAVACELVTEEVAGSVIGERLRESGDTHKGRRGHVLVIGGGPGHFGAPKLSGRAALACAAGLVTLGLPASAARIAGPMLDELMSASLPEDERGAFGACTDAQVSELLVSKSALVIGPGLGQSPGALGLLTSILRLAAAQRLKVVLDADALNLLAENEPLHAHVGKHTVLTPHPGEAGRLLGCPTEDVQSDRMLAARELSRRYGTVVVLKGARTIIAGGEGMLYVNPAATAALATAGSGDVLAGVIGSFLARGCSPVEAAMAAVFVHGCAGELSEHAWRGTAGPSASELVAWLPRLINALTSLPDPPLSKIRQVLPGSMQRLRQYFSLEDH